MYYVYVLYCKDGSLYTGITNDVRHRLEMHKSGQGSKYVRSRLPFKLVYQEEQTDKTAAMRREFEIKSWSRDQKIQNLCLSKLTKF
jgi:putative endonuclease